MLELASTMDSPPLHSHLHLPDSPEDDIEFVLDAISGKLKLICLTLFSSLFIKLFNSSMIKSEILALEVCMQCVFFFFGFKW